MARYETIRAIICSLSFVLHWDLPFLMPNKVGVVDFANSKTNVATQTTQLTTMNLNPRQVKLLNAVRLRGSATVEQLAEELGVTLQTVRRDIQRLADSKALARFHGGVRVPSSTIENITRAKRQSFRADGKARIAQTIAAQVPNNCSLILNIGTTTEAVAQALLQHEGLRVITNNINVVEILRNNDQFEVIVTGGVVRPRDGGIIGEAAVDFIRQFKVDIAIIGISGIESDGTLRDYDYREVKVTQTVMAHAREIWLAADASKFNRPAMVEVAHISRIDALFTDEVPPAPFPELLEESSVRLFNCL